MGACPCANASLAAVLEGPQCRREGERGRAGYQRGLPGAGARGPGTEGPARSSRQRDSRAAIRPRDPAGFPHSVRRPQPSILSLRGAVGSWRQAGDPRLQGRRQRLLFLLPWVLLDWVCPRQDASEALRLALCPGAVGGAPGSLVGKATDMRLPFSPRRPIIHWVTDALFWGGGGSWTRRPRPLLEPACRG